MKKNKLTQKIFNNISWLISEKLGIMLINLLTNLLIARYFQPELFGQYSYLLAIIALITPLSTMGLNSLVSRELIQHPHQQQQILSTTFALRFLGNLSLTLLMLLLIIGTSQPWQLSILVLANLSNAWLVMEFWFEATLQAKIVARVKLLIILCGAILKIFLVLTEASLTAFIFVVAAEMLMIASGLWFVFQQRNKTFRLADIHWRYGQQLLREARWLIFSGVAAAIYLKIDQLMLSWWTTDHIVGVYAVASRLSEVWYIFPTAIVVSYFPSLLQAKTNNIEHYQQKLQQLCTILFWLAIMIVLVINGIAEPLINLLFGPNYHAAAAILSLHIWAAPFIFMRALLSKWLLSENLVKFSLITQGVGALINIGLNWWLIPLYQGIGAAIATIIAYMMASMGMLLINKQTRPMAKIMFVAIIFPIIAIKQRLKNSKKIE